MKKRVLLIAFLALGVLSCGLIDSLKGGTSEPEYIVVTATPEREAAPTEAPVDAPTDASSDAPSKTAQPAGETVSITEPVAATLTLIAGPFADTLIKQDNTHTASYCAGVNVRDFKAEVTFTALPGFTNDKNSLAVYFRHYGSNDQYRVAVRQDYWTLSNVRQGDFIRVNTGNLVMNWNDASPKRVTIYAIGDTGYFYLNGYFIMKLDLSNRQEAGDVCIVASEYNGDTYGQLSTFEDFKVWELTPQQ